MFDFLTLKSIEEVLASLEFFKPLPVEEISLDEANGRTLAGPLAANENVPGFDRSTVDGFAVRARDVFGASEGAPALMDYLGECSMGEPPTVDVTQGGTAKVWTGGMMPKGADAVVMLEYAREAGLGQVELTRPAAPFENTIQAGEDVKAGQEVLPGGHFLRPQDIGLLAALGHHLVPVRRKPLAAIISTGDEVVPVTGEPGPGQVRDINSHALAALTRSWGSEAVNFGLVGDDPGLLSALVDEALSRADILLLSGGSSVGQRDFTLDVFSKLKGVEILAHGVAVSPGKPLIVAKVGQKSLWGLPGHAASAFICAVVFIGPLIRRLLGQASGQPAWQSLLKAKMTRPVSSVLGRRDFIRVSLEAPAEPGGSLLARPVLGKSGLISTLVKASALVVCDENREGLAEGEEVSFYFLPCQTN